MIYQAMLDALGADKATEWGAMARAPGGTALTRLDGAAAATGYGYGFCHALLLCIIVHSVFMRFTSHAKLTRWRRRDIFGRMGLSRMSQQVESVWDGLRLVVEERPDGGDWQLFVYDQENCEVLYMAQHISCETAKNAAVKFAVAHLYSTDHDLKPEVLSQMLVWEP